MFSNPTHLSTLIRGDDDLYTGFLLIVLLHGHLPVCAAHGTQTSDDVLGGHLDPVVDELQTQVGGGLAGAALA